MKKVAFHNLGCKVNSYELDAMQRLMIQKGYTVVPFREQADIYIINTCTVTNIADRKSRQMLHRAKKNNPESIVVAVGCYVQTEDAEALKEDGIDLCIGNNRKGQIVEILEQYLKKREQKDRSAMTSIEDLNGISSYEELFIDDSAEHSRAFIKVQDGCNQFCTYCIIPFARGRTRSRKEQSVIEEVTALAKKGYREFVVTGIHLSSYGAESIYETPKADQFHPESLLALLEKISEVPGVLRIRLGSLEPRIITEDLAKRLAGIKAICPHFHLSLQSGCNAVLKRMNRHYTAEEFMEKVNILRTYFEHPAITTDVIVGFPGETEEEFKEGREFLERVSFFEMHIFKYSKRKGTIAAELPNQLTDAKKSERSHILEELAGKQSREFREYYQNRKTEVLFEEVKEIEGNLYWVGHTKEYVKVAVKSEEHLENSIRTVEIRDFVSQDYMVGNLYDN